MQGRAHNMIRKKMRCSVEKIPEDILIKVISLLDLKEAAKTSIVSRSWRNLWKHIPDLHLNFTNVLPIETNEMLDENIPYDDGFQEEEEEDEVEEEEEDGDNNYENMVKGAVEKFVENVDTILRSRQGTGIESLAISFFFNGIEHAPVLDQWVSFACASRAKNFVLDLGSYLNIPRQACYDFPCHLLSSDHQERYPPLEDLKLECCSLRSNGHNFDGFRNLRRLTLCNVKITDRGIRDLLSTSVHMESLKIINCSRLVDLEIQSPLCKLQSLEFWNCARLRKVECYAPSLSFFGYSGKQIPLAFRRADDSLLQKARVQLYSPSLACVTNRLARDMPYLRTLELELHLESQVYDLGESLSTFVHLKHLVLIIYPDDVGCATSLLTVAPFLETYCVSFLIPEIDWEPCSRRPRTPPYNPHSHLKSFKMTGFTGHGIQLDVLNFLFKNAARLEVINIATWTADFQREPALKILNEQNVSLVPHRVKLVVLE